MSAMRPSSPDIPGGDGVVHLDEDTPGKHEAVLRNIGHLLDELDNRSPADSALREHHEAAGG